MAYFFCRKYQRIKTLMKNVYFIVTLLFCLFVQGQNSPAIKIYLEDAETGKNIPDAKVTLEGFEIPAITGKYNQKEKYYYFAEIPAGYNTIMAYHKKYNEKGFQDTGGLPKELKLKLYDPLNVSYSFEKIVLTNENCCNQGKQSNYAKKPKYLNDVIDSKKTISRPKFRYIYIEDPYHIAVLCKRTGGDCFENDSIKKILIELSLEEINYQHYGVGKFIIDWESGYLSDDPNPNQLGNVFILHKKDGSKFKRFNSPEIKKLRSHNLIIASFTNRQLEYYSDIRYDANKFYEYTTKKNYYGSSHTFYSPREIRQTFSNTLKKDLDNYYGKNKKNLTNDRLPTSDDNKIFSSFFVIANTTIDGIGLGALDNMELNKSSIQDYIFNNSLQILFNRTK
jgi:hypothetical protein